jgi:hypothetical protein
MLIVSDCLSRANDAMERDDPTRIDWVYVLRQLNLASDNLIDASGFARDMLPVVSKEPETADMLDIPDDADLTSNNGKHTHAQGGGI